MRQDRKPAALQKGIERTLDAGLGCSALAGNADADDDDQQSGPQRKLRFSVRLDRVATPTVAQDDFQPTVHASPLSPRPAPHTSCGR